MEFACNVAGSKIVMVLGHTRCGAVKGAVANVQMGHLTGLLDKLRPAIGSLPGVRKVDDQYVDQVAMKNVSLTVTEIRKRSEILRRLEAEGKISIVGGMYDVETGHVDFCEDAVQTTAQREKADVKS
jgi:carbonic anhydrase